MKKPIALAVFLCGGLPMFFFWLVQYYPQSVISVIMIIAFVFEQMFCHFEGAMGFHCNREVTKQMTKRRFH